jgi:hypothetical protein
MFTAGFALCSVLSAATGSAPSAVIFGAAALVSLVGLLGARRTRIEVATDAVHYQPSFGSERTMTKDECAAVRIVGGRQRALAQLAATDGRRIAIPLLGPAVTAVPEQLRRAGWPVEDARR